MRPRVVPLLYALAALFLALGLAAPAFARRSWSPPPDLEAGRAAPAAPQSAASPGVPLRSGLADDVVATNLFSPRRTSPTVRYTSDSLAPTREAPPSPPARRAIRLFGVGMTGARATALLDADPRVPGAEIYHVGDRLPEGGRVESIAADNVVIITPEGRQRLRLESSAAPPLTSVPPEQR